MKLKNILYYLAVIILFTSQLWATNTNPVVTNVTFSISGTTVTVHYDVTDAEQDTVTISMQVSSDGGATWDYDYTTPGPVNGDIGAGIVIGNSKTITWIYPGVQNSNFQISIYANDEVADGSPCPGTATVVYLGTTYNTIQIGGQCWLKENLNVGTMINITTGGTNGDGNQTNNGIIEKYCYNDDTTNCTTYGGLYQWAEAVAYANGATDTSFANPPLTGNVQGICPTGWHIPTNAEYQTLGTAASNDGNALKAVGQDGTSTNTSGFSALLAGLDIGYFHGLGSFANFWSTTEYDTPYADILNLYVGDSYVGFNYSNKAYGFSVRCAKDF